MDGQVHGSLRFGWREGSGLVWHYGWVVVDRVGI